MEATSHSNDPAAAFEALFRAHHDDLFRFCLRRVGADAARDVVAEVFLVAWRRRADMPPGAERLWLFRVAANVIANQLRGARRRDRLRRRVSAEPQSPAPEARDPGESIPTSLSVRQVLASLPAHEQEALRLTEWDQFDIAEAAAVAGCTRATFRVRLHRARRRLAERLVEPQAGPSMTSTETEDVIL
ncbi:MAG TPA: RNA polymerase sigma factor [Micromonosporaceae bacterium]